MQGKRRATAWHARGAKVHRSPKVMAHVRRLLRAKFKRELQRKKRAASFAQLEQHEKERVLGEAQDRQKMLRMLIN